VLWLREIIYGIENIIVWWKFTWHDRDWDYDFLIARMAYKMERMARHHRKYGICENSQEIAEELEECARLLKVRGDHGELDKINEALDFMKEKVRGWWD